LERQHRERLQKGGNMIGNYDPMSFVEIAQALNLSRTRVEQIYKKAIKKLQANPDTQILTDFLPEQPNESTNRNNRHYDRY
jgi:DNA-directed RNA polymerase sigma subunit (sigma70/sigma32)